jgi:serine/threonine protein kinase
MLGEPPQVESASSFRAGYHELQFLSKLAGLLSVIRLYPPEHALVAEAISGFAQSLGDFIGRRNKAYVLVDEQRALTVNSRLVRASRSMGAKLDELTDTLVGLGVGALLFTGQWDASSVSLLAASLGRVLRGTSAASRVGELSNSAKEIPAPAQLAVLDAAQGVLFAREEEEGHLDDFDLATFYYARLVALAEANHQAIRAGLGPDVHARNVRQTMQKIADHLRSRPFEHRLVALTCFPPGGHDPLAFHEVNTTVLSLAMGHLLGLPAHRLVSLGFAALFHDAGRVSPASDGDSSEDEDGPSGDVRHVTRGVAVCLRGRISGEASLVRLAVVHEHHRPSDGYPKTMLREPHAFSKLVAVASKFDRLQNGTASQAALGPAAAFAKVAELPRADRAAVDLLRDVLGKHPRGSVLRLANGVLAVALASTSVPGEERTIVREVSVPGSAPALADRLTELRERDVFESLVAAPADIDWRNAVLAPYPRKLSLIVEEQAAAALLKRATASLERGSALAQSLGSVDAMVLANDGSRAYLLGNLLGGGAQGMVYEVTIEGERKFPGLDEPVSRAVIKVARRGAETILEREGEIYSTPRPSVVTLLDHGDAGARPYLVLERLEPLPHERFGTKRVDPATAVDIFVNLLVALHRIHFEHEAPLVLADVKPANVLLRMRKPTEGAFDDAGYLRALASGELEPVFSDLGCALDRRALDAKGGEHPELVGTPLYLPPESCPLLLGEKIVLGRYSRMTDVYALTLAFYVLLTGEQPYASRAIAGSDQREKLLALFELKKAGVDPIDERILSELFDHDLALDLQRVLAAGLVPSAEARATPHGLLDRCRRLFRVEEEKDSAESKGPRLRLRQTRIPRISPEGENPYQRPLKGRK